MPMMKYTPEYFSEPSELSPGYHPAFLLYVSEEDTPEDWPMYENSERMWRWHFAIAESETTLDAYVPEYHNAISSAKFKGGKHCTKSYTWLCTILGRDIPKDESIDPNDLVPLPCTLLIGRHDKNGKEIEYANIEKVQHWAGGMEKLTPAMKAKLETFWKMKQADGEGTGDAEPGPRAMPPAPQMSPAPAPAAVPPAPAPAPASAGRQAW